MWTKNSDLDFFVDVETSKMNPYFSEQFVVRWYLYTNGRVTDIDTLKYPTLEGLWKEEISLVTSLRGEKVKKNNQFYTRYLLSSYALTPITQEKVYLDPYEIKCRLAGGMFSLGQKELVRKSDEAIIQVKPLPKPPDSFVFTGAVGQFNAVSYVESQDFKVGQPLTYVLRVQGRGQLKFMELPDLQLDSEQFDIYDIKEESQFTPPESTTKIYRVLAVPKKSGQLTLPAVSFGFFNPNTQKYYKRITQSHGVTVQPNPSWTSEENHTFSIFDNKNLNQKEPVPLDSISLVSYHRPLPWLYYLILYLVVLSICLSILGYKFLSLQVSYDFSKDLSERFEVLEKKIAQDQWREASTDAVNILYFFVNQKSKNKPKSQSLEDILEALPVGLRRKIELSLKELNTSLQKYSFAHRDLLTQDSPKSAVLKKCLALKTILKKSLEDKEKKGKKESLS